MTSDKFLSSVANYYLKADIDLSELCLVFPNKRAAIFFRNYFKKNSDKLTFIPDIKTIGSLNEIFSDKQLADHTELIFALYSAYRTVMTRNNLAPMEFNKFAFWGDMILSDFNDIDAEMADAQKLFTNITRYNEISSDYLTDEQRSVIKSIWGAEASAYIHGSSDRFWLHVQDDSYDNDDEKASVKFRKLWQILAPLYQEFNKILAQKELTYPGLLSREVTNAIIATPVDELPFKRIGFVGFNKVNLSLAKLMNTLQTRNMADFFWDLLPKEKEYCERAGMQVAKLSEHFPMPWSADVAPTFNNDCEVNVYAIPSNTLQAKAAGNILAHWNKFNDINGERIINTSRPDNTAIILPDQSMLSATLMSIPSEINDINITMGLSYRDTPFASLLHAIVSLHMRCRYLHDKPHYFYEDISALITHPNLRAIALKSCLAIKEHIDKHHQYNIPIEDLHNIIKAAQSNDADTTEHDRLSAEAMLCLFTDVKDVYNITQVKAYITKLISSLRAALISSVQAINEDAHEIKVLNAYQDAINRVFDCMDKYRISGMSQGSIFSMLDKMLSLSTINMSGTPLSGLQIMGVLETRALDFDNVIILSMNERVYPKRNRQRSMISQQIRHAFFLPSADTAEQEYSYYFFRLFSRAKRVICLYDSRANGAGNGAMSRYLLQMSYLNKGKPIYFGASELTATTGNERTITVCKDNKVMAELAAFKSLGDNALNLSASALKKYRSCKLAFYLQYVKRVREDIEPTAYMDAATYGTVMHNVLQHLFKSQRREGSTLPIEISQAVLTKMKGSAASMLELVKLEINRTYHDCKYNNRLDYMPAESQILAEIMAEFITNILNKEIEFVKENGNFYFVDAEESICTQWQATPNNKINFRLDIDRHDMLKDGIHRFIDYKTGKDKTDFSNIATLFSPENNNANDACLQLLTYAAAYSDIKGVNFDIKPALYQLIKAADTTSDFYADGDRLRILDKQSPVDPIIWSNKNPEGWQTEFRSRLEHMIDEIFDEKIPFTQTEFIDNCRYCKFTQMCARIVPENDY